MKTKSGKYPLQENLFTTIAKILTLKQLRRNLGSAEKMTKGDAEIQATLTSMQYHAERLEKLLKSICERDPTNIRCKEYRQQKDSKNFK